MTLVDLLTILPVYLAFGLGSSYTAFKFLQCLRILKLLRIFKTFKPMRNTSAVRRQLIILVLTLVSMVFLFAGIVQIMENDVQQLEYGCKYINENTNWLPSCSTSAPANDDCDCQANNCLPQYNFADYELKHTGISCIKLPYFDAIYFIIITIATVG